MATSEDLTSAELDEGIEHLRRLLRIDTTYPPGNELEAARYLAGVLGDDGIESRIVEPAPGRAVLHARIPGSGSRRPVLLAAHMDVVGADATQWSTDPFGAELRDGYVYGRGAIDDKGMLAANLMAFLRVHRARMAGGAVHERDLVLLATSDEESGGAFGMPWIIANHPELVDAEFAINEGGRVRIVEGRPRYAAIQTAEKIPYVVSMKAAGPGGHASVPVEGMAIGRLARALSIITSTRQPVDLSPTTREFFGRLGPIWPDRDLGKAMSDVASHRGGADERAAAQLARVPRFDALLRDTLAPAMLAAGTRHNVIPPTAEATLSLRLLPGHRPEAVLGELARLIDDPGVTLAIESRGCEAPASDIDSPLFLAMAAALAAIDPGIVAVPYLSTGATESAYLRAAGVQCCGILPFPLTDDDESRMHGHDERLATDAFAFGIRLIGGTVTRLLGA